jgi:hypothetical protein
MRNTEDILVDNNCSSTDGMIICVDIPFEVAIDGDIERQVRDCICNGLQRAHSRLDGFNMWHYVYGVRHDQWQHSESSPRLNGLQFTVHFAKDDTIDSEWPLFQYDGSAREAISAMEIANELKDNTPACVEKIGVSAVCESYVMDQWHATIDPDGYVFCRPGNGCVHEMHTLHCLADSPCPLVCAEMSSSFGWPD